MENNGSVVIGGEDELVESDVLGDINFPSMPNLVASVGYGDLIKIDEKEHLSSELNWIQKILSSARMGGISGPLVRVGYHQNVDLFHHAHYHLANTNQWLVVVQYHSSYTVDSIKHSLRRLGHKYEQSRWSC